MGRLLASSPAASRPAYYCLYSVAMSSYTYFTTSRPLMPPLKRRENARQLPHGEHFETLLFVNLRGYQIHQ